MSITAEDFCSQFSSSLKYITDVSDPNWFGRLLAYQYKLELDGKMLDQNAVVDQIRNGYQIDIDPATITYSSFVEDVHNGSMRVLGTVNVSVNGGSPELYDFSHNLKWTLHATSSKLTKRP